MACAHLWVYGTGLAQCRAAGHRLAVRDGARAKPGFEDSCSQHCIQLLTASAGNCNVPAAKVGRSLLSVTKNIARETLPCKLL